MRSRQCAPAARTAPGALRFSSCACTNACSSATMASAMDSGARPPKGKPDRRMQPRAQRRGRARRARSSSLSRRAGGPSRPTYGIGLRGQGAQVQQIRGQVVAHDDGADERTQVDRGRRGLPGAPAARPRRPGSARRWRTRGGDPPASPASSAARQTQPAAPRPVRPPAPGCAATVTGAAGRVQSSPRPARRRPPTASAGGKRRLQRRRAQRRGCRCGHGGGQGESTARHVGARRLAHDPDGRGCVLTVSRGEEVQRLPVVLGTHAQQQDPHRPLAAEAQTPQQVLLRCPSRIASVCGSPETMTRVACSRRSVSRQPPESNPA